MGLHQVNDIANGRGRFLDIVLTNRPEDTGVFKDVDSHLIISPTEHHVPYTVTCKHTLIASEMKYRTITKYDNKLLAEYLSKIALSFIPSRTSVMSQLKKINEAHLPSPIAPIDTYYRSASPVRREFHPSDRYRIHQY